MVTTPNYDLDIDTTLGGNNASDYVVPSQKAIKAYVDNSTGGNVMWGNIAGNISNQTDLQDALDDKQDALVSGSNIKTINSTSILGSGNISVATSAQGALADTALQPNDNISELTNNAGYITSSALAPYALSADLATVATSGSYNDLTNKPTIPAAQVNSDWNATSGKAQILNKPTLATVATSGSYNDLSNKPTIPSEVTESTVSGWGFTKNTGTVTSVNNIAPVNGNVTVPIPDTATWGNISGTLSNQTDLQTALNGKQATLVSGTNIKTVNGNSLLGSGDITIQSGASYSAVCPAITPVDGVATWVVTHNLGTSNVVASLYSNGAEVEKNITVINNNTIQVDFKASSNVSAGSHTIVVLASGGEISGDDTYTNSSINAVLYGGLTNTGGVLSGFASGSKYAQTSYAIPLGTDFEVFAKVKTGNIAATEITNIFTSNDGVIFVLQLNTLKVLEINYGNGSWAGPISGITTIQSNTDYWIKVVFKNSTISLYLSTDGETFNLENSAQYAGNLPSTTMNVGCARVTSWNTGAWEGSIDLKESYIKSNGVTVWQGAEYSDLTSLVPVTDYYINGSSWYKETFADSTRTKRIWLEQGGKSNGGSGSFSTTNFLKPFSNTNYTMSTAVINSENNNTNFGVKIANKTVSSFQHRTWYGTGSAGAYDFDWRACGV